jgi:hypothetical protein
VKVNFKLIAALAAGLLSAAPAFSAAVTLDFEGASSFASIADFYNGGTDTEGASGSNYGVLFGGDALALSNDQDFTYFSNAPTPGSILAPVGPDAALNAASGFAGTVSFYYSTAAAATVSIFSGLDGTGDLLGTFSLLTNAQNGCGDASYCHWDLASLTFAGVARSIQFGTAAGAGFDNVTIAPVPLPAAVWLLLSGLTGFGTLARRKRNV